MAFLVCAKNENGSANEFSMGAKEWNFLGELQGAFVQGHSSSKHDWFLTMERKVEMVKNFKRTDF